MTDVEINKWEYDPKALLLSSRKVKGIFHKSEVDKDGEFITPDAIRKSIPDYMHLPALHDFHKERPVGLATKVWELEGGRFGFEGVIKATSDCDDVWEKIQKGNYDHVSIFGKREHGNSNCSLPSQLRTGPCITSGVRLDSISVCDDNARNDSTSLEVRKGVKMVFDAETLIKAETASSSNLMHQSTDYAGKKDAVDTAQWKVEGKRAKKEELKRKTEQGHHRPTKWKDGPDGEYQYDPHDHAKGTPLDEEKKCSCGSGKDVISKPKKYRVVEKSDTQEQRDQFKKDSSTGTKPTRRKDAPPVVNQYERDELGKGRTDRKPFGYLPGSKDNMHERNKGASLGVSKRPTSVLDVHTQGYARGTTQQTRKQDREYQETHKKEERASAMEGMRNLHKGDDGDDGMTQDSMEKGLKSGNCETCGSKRCSSRSSGVTACAGFKKKKGSPYTEEQSLARNKMTTEEVEKGTKIQGDYSGGETAGAGEYGASHAGAGHKTKVRSHETVGETGENPHKREPRGRYDRGAVEFAPRTHADPKRASGKKSTAPGPSFAERSGRMETVPEKKQDKPSPRSKEGGTVHTPKDTPLPEKNRVRCKNCAQRGTNTSPKGSKQGYCGAGGGQTNKMERNCSHFVKKSEENDDMTEEEYIEKSDEDFELEKAGQKVTESGDDDDQYDEDDDSSKKKVSKDDKEGRWSKKGDPNGTVKMSKAQDKGKPEKDEDDSEEDEEEAEDESEEDVEKGEFDKVPRKHLGGKSYHQDNKDSLRGNAKHSQAMAMSSRSARAYEQDPKDSHQQARKYASEEAAQGLKKIPMRKGDLKKGENMEEDNQEDNVQEYVTKAMVPIEEVDTIIKARTDEISKAYTVQIDELKKAHSDLVSKVEKMEQETIRKGGNIIVIPQLLDPENKGMLSNADAVARMQAGRT